MSSTEQTVQVYQLRIWIREISPQIWRCLLVRSDSTIAQLHDTLQIAFGWTDEHSYTTELINGGVSLPTICKRLGHKNLQTTLRYAEQTDATADAEVRAWRRLHDRHSSFEGRREGGSP